jgi:hypothetical protein
MLAATRRAPDEVVGLIPPAMEPATVRTVAIHALMAGCKPEYLPVVSVPKTLRPLPVLALASSPAARAARGSRWLSLLRRPRARPPPPPRARLQARPRSSSAAWGKTERGSSPRWSSRSAAPTSGPS